MPKESKERNISKISLICSIIGILILFIIAKISEPLNLSISEISKENIGENVKVTGFIIDRNDHKDGHIFLKIEESYDSSIEVPLFSDFVEILNDFNFQKAKTSDLKIGTLLSVEGIVGEYNGKMQVVPKNPNDLKIIYD